MKSKRIERLTTYVLAVSLCAMLAAACGNGEVNRSNNGEGDTGTADVSGEVGPAPGLQSFASQTSIAMCEKLFECCSEQEINEKLGDDISSAEECADRNTAISLVFGLGYLNESVEAGRIEVDSEVISVCTQSISDVSCDRITNTTSLESYSGCSDVLNPTISEGGECEFDEECLTGFCKQPDGGGPGECATVPAEGEPCPDLRCERDSYCSSFTEMCEPKLPAGESCEDDFACQSDNCAEGDGGNLVCQEAQPLCTGG